MDKFTLQKIEYSKSKDRFRCNLVAMEYKFNTTTFK
jgi:hypothetical protein